MLAYAVDEAVDGATRSVDVSVRADGSIVVADDGRGTDTRRDERGTWQVKPIMSTRDLRFFDLPGSLRLADGIARSGMSVVAAMSTWLEHVNIRADGAWTARYEAGLPVGVPKAYQPASRATGTFVHFRPDPEVYGEAGVDVGVLDDLLRGVESPARIRLTVG